jgi:uncharacterized protein (UPF0276 family)
MTCFIDIKKKLPLLGVGIGLRREIAQDIFANDGKIDWLEFTPENYMGLGGMARERLEHAHSCFPLLSHGINLSIGATDDLNEDYLYSLKVLLDKFEIPWWSDHLCFTSYEGIYMHDLLPLPFSKEAVNHVVKRIKQAQNFIERPFLIENISYYMQMPMSSLTEAQFLSEVLEGADCGLLLDINNVYVNSINHSFDPYKFLDQIPLERTAQIHIAGHKKIDDYVIDTHGAAVSEPVFDLLRYVLQKTTVNAVLLERDQNFPEFEELMNELNAIQMICQANNKNFANLKEKANVSKSNIAKVPEKDFSSINVKGGRDVRALSA